LKNYQQTSYSKRHSTGENARPSLSGLFPPLCLMPRGKVALALIYAVAKERRSSLSEIPRMFRDFRR